jgi:hypothetical protein
MVGAVNSVMNLPRGFISVATPIGKEPNGTDGMAGPGLARADNSQKEKSF